MNDLKREREKEGVKSYLVLIQKGFGVMIGIAKRFVVRMWVGTS